MVGLSKKKEAKRDRPLPMERAYLCASGSILSCAPSNQLCLVVLHQLIVESHVFIFRENGIVGFEAVLLEQRIISTSYCD